MPVYDATAYDPLAPVATVALRDTISGTQIPNVPLLLDTARTSPCSRGQRSHGSVSRPRTAPSTEGRKGIRTFYLIPR